MGQTYTKDTNDEDLHPNICEDYSTSAEDDFLELDAPLLGDEDCQSPLSRFDSNDSDDRSSMGEDAGSSILSSSQPSDDNSFQSSDEEAPDDGSTKDNDGTVPSNGTTNGDRHLVIVDAPTSTGTEDGPRLVQHLSDLLSLDNADIKTRVNNATFTMDTVRSADSIVSSTSLISDEDIRSWYHEENSAGHRTNDTAANGDRKSHMQVALFILKNSPPLKAIRFRMVPAKIKEAPFWNAVFYLLLTDEEQSLMKAKTELANAETSNASRELSQTGGSRSVNAGLIIAQKNQEIAKLTEKVVQLEKSLSELESQQRQTTNAHKGKWVQDKESLEFLALDEEIKQKLREGKKKRLDDVHEQMKFILDSDDVKDSRGRWDCCGQTDYNKACAC